MKYAVRIREKSLTGDTVKTITVSAPNEKSAVRKAEGGILNNGRRKVIGIEQIGSEGPSSDASIPGSNLGCQTIGILLIVLGAANIIGTLHILAVIPALGKVTKSLGDSMGTYPLLGCLALVPAVFAIIGITILKKKSSAIGLLLLVLGGTPTVLGAKGLYDMLGKKSPPPTPTTPTENP